MLELTVTILFLYPQRSEIANTPEEIPAGQENNGKMYTKGIE
jgi:hypothetical protein